MGNPFGNGVEDRASGGPGSGPVSALTASLRRCRAPWRRPGPPGRWRDAGMATSEYAMVTIAACALAAVLYRIVTSGPVARALEALIGKALDAQF
ncbi:DUF4244 domain-containing protein [Streptomyces clavuligerus]|nr:DUF4244 domain-containing protein [Streptomyces clavuligerus]QPL66614.1 DUF4244 domain-containing protein [Streptomyces clavuligerus]QPL72645.1 DUF4244 domain-containing protein [Streptomyces clavuligerus]QPL78722.1 DUF4244 domain-containing protein [Streptomyces clavuligerus]QPL84749.1 DUF4244 domain-containing protein [Streptomyces clavuligerus]